MKKKREYKYLEEKCPFGKYHWQLQVKYTYPAGKPYRLCEGCEWFRNVKIDKILE